MPELDRYLEDLENRIVPAVEENLFVEWEAFTRGRSPEPIFSPRRTQPIPPELDWPRVTVNQALADFDMMALRQFRSCSDVLARASGEVLCVRSNYGVGIIPTLFGTELFVMDEKMDTLPTSIPLPGGADQIRALVQRGVPDLEAGLGGKVFEMGRRFRMIMEKYPKIGCYVHLYHPDLQGPMDVCELVWGSALFLALIEMPDLVKECLNLITETYLRFMCRWNEIVPPSGDYSTHWGLVHRGRIMIRDDSAMNLSPAMFEEFIRPYDQRLLNELGGGAVHFCGRGTHFVPKLAGMKNLYAVNLSQPELNDMESIFQNTVDRGIKLLNLARPAAEEALKRGRDLRGHVHCW